LKILKKNFPRHPGAAAENPIRTVPETEAGKTGERLKNINLREAENNVSLITVVAAE
jgi:hypothetical protein